MGDGCWMIEDCGNLPGVGDNVGGFKTGALTEAHGKRQDALRVIIW